MLNLNAIKSYIVAAEQDVYRQGKYLEHHLLLKLNKSINADILNLLRTAKFKQSRYFNFSLILITYKSDFVLSLRSGGLKLWVEDELHLHLIDSIIKDNKTEENESSFIKESDPFKPVEEKSGLLTKRTYLINAGTQTHIEELDNNREVMTDYNSARYITIVYINPYRVDSYHLDQKISNSKDTKVFWPITDKKMIESLYCTECLDFINLIDTNIFEDMMKELKELCGDADIEKKFKRKNYRSWHKKYLFHISLLPL